MIIARLFSLLVLTLAGFMMPLWFFLVCAACYALFFSPYEPFVIAVLIDAEFGEAARGFPYLYTALMLVVLVFVRTVRPRFRL